MGNQKPERMYKLFTGHWIDLEHVLSVSELYIRDQGTLPIYFFEVELMFKNDMKFFEQRGTLKLIAYDATDSYVKWCLESYSDKYPNCSTKEEALAEQDRQEKEEFQSFQQKHNSFIEDLKRYKNGTHDSK